MSNIILEGVDGTGKSSYSKKIVENESVPQDKIQRQEKYTTLKEGIIDLLSSTEDNVVYDRHIISLLVYHIVNKKKEEKEFVYLRSLFKEFVSRNEGVHLFYLTAGYSAVKYILINREKRLNRKGIQLSEHDKRIIKDKEYFDKTKEAFSRLINILIKINEKNDSPMNISILSSGTKKLKQRNIDIMIEKILASKNEN